MSRESPPSDSCDMLASQCEEKLRCGCEEQHGSQEDDHDSSLRGRAVTDLTALDNSLDLPWRLTSSRSISSSFSFFGSGYDQYDYGADCGLAPWQGTLYSNASVGNDNVVYQPYYQPQDFSSQTWLTAISETISIHALAGGATMVLGAVVIIHPLVLVSAATAAATAAVGATAMYAIGLLCDFDNGYELWSSEDFSSLFWKDAPNVLTTGVTTSRLELTDGVNTTSVLEAPLGVPITPIDSTEIRQKGEEHLPELFLLEEQAREKLNNENLLLTTKDKTTTVKNQETLHQQQSEGKNKKKGNWTKRPDFKIKRMSRKSTQSSAVVQKALPAPPQQTTPSSTTAELRRTHSAPAVPLPVKVSLDHLLDKSSQQPNKPSHVQPPNTTTLLHRHFPPLETCVIHQVSFPGLHTAEFFRVFFANDAVYSMKDFQSKKGDVDVVYGKWGVPKDRDTEIYASFKAGGDLIPVAASNVRERTINFNTLTKSYFGPAYARATKRERAIQISDNLLVIEKQTQLADIPFADRFLVVERWIVEAVTNHKVYQTDPDSASVEDMAMYTSKLTVYAEVVMLKSCSWETQIQKKASETIADLVKDWCKTATKALKATDEQKRMRLSLSNRNSKENTTKLVAASSVLPAITTSSELIARHRRNFQELDKRIANGDLEWCSIEVMHLTKGERHSAFAQVLESHSADAMTRLSTSSTEETDVTDSTDGSKTVSTTARRKSKNFLNRLSSRKNKFDVSIAKTG